MVEQNIFFVFGQMQGILANILMFVVVGIIIGSFLFIIIFVKKTKKLKFPVLEIIKLKHGRIAINKTKAGWFKRQQKFFGLIEKGEELMMTEDKRIIADVSAEDFEEINGKRGLVVRRKDDDPKILLPISRIQFQNENLLMEIAPADFRDTAIRLLEQEADNLKTGFEKKLPQIINIGLVVITMIVLMFLIQQSSQALQQTADKCLAYQQACKTTQTAPPPASNTAP